MLCQLLRMLSWSQGSLILLLVSRIFLWRLGKHDEAMKLIGVRLLKRVPVACVFFSFFFFRLAFIFIFSSYVVQGRHLEA